MEMQMNEEQKKVLIAVVAAIGLMLLYPPFHARLPNGVTKNLGYSWIFEPPMGGAWGSAGTVDVAMLFTQWVGVLIVGAIAFFLFKDR